MAQGTRTGPPALADMDLDLEVVASRFWAKVEKTNSCWIWHGAGVGNGYGKLTVGSEQMTAHRVAYQLVKGRIPATLHIDHLCRNRACVNPDHLEPVSQRENTLRGTAPSALNAALTRCIAGHEFTPENTYVHRHGSGWARQCRTCQSLRRAAYRARGGR